MASVVKRAKSKYWHAVYRVPVEGGGTKQVFRSTKKTNKREALTSAVDMERAERDEVLADDPKAREMLEVIKRATMDASRGAMTEKKGRDYISEIVMISTGINIREYSIEEWYSEWLLKQGGLAPTTLIGYRSATKKFMTYLGDAKTNTIKSINASTIVNYRTWMVNGSGVGKSMTNDSINQNIRHISIALNVATDAGLFKINPASNLPALAKGKKSKRKPFTAEEVNKLILGSPTEEWGRMITVAAFTGLRMADCARLDWDMIDMDKRLIVLDPQKTLWLDNASEANIPIHPTLYASLVACQSKTGKVHPTLSKVKGGGSTGLSQQFIKIMKSAGVSRGEPRVRGNKTLYERSFHSFRHTLISWLANAGANKEVRKKIVTHSSDKTHEIYTHWEHDTLKQAMNSIPTLTDSE